MSKRRAGSRLLLLLTVSSVIVLSGCAFNRVFTPEVHKVHKGESLSSIAASYGLNWHDLAQWNNIGPPYTIHIDQRLSLDPFPPLNYDRMRDQRLAARAERQATPRSTVTAMPRSQGPSVTRLPGQGQAPQQTIPQQTIPQQQIPRQPAVPSGNSSVTPVQPPEQAGPTPQSTKPNNPAVAQQPPPQSAPVPPLVSAQGWRWPLATAMLKAHDAETARHGLNLYGVVGTPVYAARAGQVVYSGAGLQGFGTLVIIKHDDEYLSAYGYTRNPRVEEGDRIVAGQQIADMGMGPGSRAALHFEIRHEGEPIDPTSVLPQLRGY